MMAFQAGRGRTTLGMVVACFIKEIQLRAELLRMSDMGLIPAATVQVNHGGLMWTGATLHPNAECKLFPWWQIDNDTVPSLNTTHPKLLTAEFKLETHDFVGRT